MLKGGVVAGVELVRIERARRTQRIGVGVDVEVALHGAKDGIDLGRERTGSPLVAVRSVTDDIEREFVLQDALGGIEQTRIAAHLALHGPSRIGQHTDRSVVGALLGTRGDADRVVVLNGVAEQLLEPVGIAHLGLTQVGGAAGRRILDHVAARRRVVGLDKLRELLVDAARRVVDRRGVVQPALLVHLFVDAHLLLRIHDVEGGVLGNHAHGELARVADARHAGRTLLGRHDDHARHGARTVDRGRRTVLQIWKFSISSAFRPAWPN